MKERLDYLFIDELDRYRSPILSVCHGVLKTLFSLGTRCNCSNPCRAHTLANPVIPCWTTTCMSIPSCLLKKVFSWTPPGDCIRIYVNLCQTVSTMGSSFPKRITSRSVEIQSGKRHWFQAGILFIHRTFGQPDSVQEVDLSVRIFRNCLAGNNGSYGQAGNLLKSDDFLFIAPTTQVRRLRTPCRRAKVGSVDKFQTGSSVVILSLSQAMEISFMADFLLNRNMGISLSRHKLFPLW